MSNASENVKVAKIVVITLGVLAALCAFGYLICRLTRHFSRFCAECDEVEKEVEATDGEELLEDEKACADDESTETETV